MHVDEGEIRTLLHAGAGVAHNPSSNLKLASGVAPVKRMLELGVNVGIGTDGPASNNDLDMFEEIRLAALLAKGNSGDPTALPAKTTLLMATRLGAQAMHLGEVTGSLEAGKRADLILVELNRLHNSPRFLRDPQGTYAQLIYAAKATDVSDVMINGQWVMRERNLLTLDEEELLYQAQEYAKKIDVFLIQREKSVLAKLIAIAAPPRKKASRYRPRCRLGHGLHPDCLDNAQIEIVRMRHYREYDVYFSFDEAEQAASATGKIIH